MTGLQYMASKFNSNTIKSKMLPSALEYPLFVYYDGTNRDILSI